MMIEEFKPFNDYLISVCPKAKTLFICAHQKKKTYKYKKGDKLK